MRDDTDEANMKYMTDKEEFLLRLKDPNYCNIKAAVHDFIDRYRTTLEGADIFQSQTELNHNQPYTNQIMSVHSEYEVCIYAKNSTVLDQLIAQFKNTVIKHLGTPLVHTDVLAVKGPDGLWFRRFYIIPHDPNIPL